MQNFLRQLAQDRLRDQIRAARLRIAEALEALDTYRMLPSEVELEAIENELLGVQSLLQQMANHAAPKTSSPSSEEVAQRRRRTDSFAFHSNPMRKENE
ncbi:hypothetical protein DTL42_18635 [Bremerella cremea]|uniref:Uncharacterized protein n=1 Tax=Bremerella cremea TaxID=1031537 RepID=A0A368KRE9_9BACT|nr:hypothetical protein [Bremerella cremea]RCS44001.1 hypothetical protein DTL42_18635 [Bremerella cremea]